MNIENYMVVIMAGGMGTRISCIEAEVPKPMIKVWSKPILEYQIECLKRQGIKEVTLVVGHLNDVIINYFGNGQAFDLKISYLIEERPLGTAGALKKLKVNKPIILINGDIIFDINLSKMLDYHEMRLSDITLFTHPNNHPYDSALIETKEDGQIIKWINKEDIRGDYKNRVNAGIHVINNEVILRSFKINNQQEKYDLDRDIIKPNINQYRVFAYDSPEYVKDMGTPERLLEVEVAINKGIVQTRNLNIKQKAIFLDRDGTINEYRGYISKKEELVLLKGASEAIKRINNSEYLAIVVTNQPIIARGECSIEELEAIHKRLERLLGEQGAYIDDLIYCPHHPDRGFDGERIEYKCECGCRKPKAGMLVEMSNKYNIDLSKSFMIGDDERDIEAGNAAGCKTIYIGKTEKVRCIAEWMESNLQDAVDRVLGFEGIVK